MPGRVNNEKLVEDFLKGHPLKTIADFRGVDVVVIEDVIRKVLKELIEGGKA